MSKTVQKGDGARAGFNTSFVKPVHPQPPAPGLRFGLFDAVLIVALIIGTIAAMRLLVAH